MSSKVHPTRAPSALVSVPSANESQALALPSDIMSELQASTGVQLAANQVRTPYLVLLQSLSPQCTPGNGNYVEGAKPGMILNVGTKEIASTVVAVPAWHREAYNVWVPRDKGGGFRGEMPLEAAKPIYYARIDRKTGRCVLEDGNELVETLYVYLILSHKTADGHAMLDRAVISAVRTQIVPILDWLNIIRTYTPIGMTPRRGGYGHWAAAWTLTSKPKHGPKGNWFIWEAHSPRSITNIEAAHVIIETAKDLELQVRAGRELLDMSAMETEAGAELSSSSRADGM